LPNISGHAEGFMIRDFRFNRDLYNQDAEVVFSDLWIVIILALISIFTASILNN